MKLKISLLLLLLLLEYDCFNVESKRLKGCDLAFASYYVSRGLLLQNIARFMQSKIVSNSDVIISYNKDNIFNGNVLYLTRLNVPFPYDCIDGEFLGHMFEYLAAAGMTHGHLFLWEQPNFKRLWVVYYLSTQAWE